MGKRFLGFSKVARCDVNVADKFIDVFRDDLKLDSHVSETFTIAAAFLNGKLVHSSELGSFYQSYRSKGRVQV